MPSVYSSACLPAIFEGTPIGVNGEDMSTATIRDIAGEHLPPEVKKASVFTDPIHEPGTPFGAYR